MHDIDLGEEEFVFLKMDFENSSKKQNSFQDENNNHNPILLKQENYDEVIKQFFQVHNQMKDKAHESEHESNVFLSTRMVFSAPSEFVVGLMSAPCSMDCDGSLVQQL